MSGFQTIKRQLLPLLKGLPLIVGGLVIALFIARKIINYTPNSYQTIARIKLDDQKYGFSNNLLYSDFDVFSTENKIQAEAAILQSPLLVGMALDQLDFRQAIYRKGKLKNTLLYKDSPILIEYEFEASDLFDKDYFIQVKENDAYQLLNEKGEDIEFPEVQLGESIILEGGVLLVKKNDSLLNVRDLHLAGDYIFHVFSRNGLIEDVIDRLDVVEVDKEMPIIRVVYKDQHPQKVADLANQLCETYIKDYVTTKSHAAQQTLDFIDQKLQEVMAELQNAEIALEQYKARNGVVNTRQETETGLRQISSLEVQLINLEMNEKAILELETYISSGDYFNERAINFGFGDLLMTELVKKLKLWQDERIDLLMKYTEESDEVKSVDQKIEELKKYIVEAIKRNKQEILSKRENIKKSVEMASMQFEGLSTREKELRILERNFHLQEQVYNFLSQKKIEASIATSARLAFHRIIQKATVPNKAVAPNGTLITFVSGLLGLILSITFIYLRQSALARVSGRHDIERHSSLPLLGLIRSENASKDFCALMKVLQLKNHLDGPVSIAITSTISQEGKTFVSQNLAESLSQAGKKVALVSLDLDAHVSDANPIPGSSYESIILRASKDFDLKAKLKELKASFDVILIDSPSAAMKVEGIECMKEADTSIYVLRSNKTSVDYLSHAEFLAEEYQINNLFLLLNDAHKASNFSGNFVGTRFKDSSSQLSLFPKIKNYLNTYVR